MILETKCAGILLTNQCSCQVLSKICIDDRLANSNSSLYVTSKIDLSNVMDYYRLLSEKIVVVLQVNQRHNVVYMVLLSHSIIIAYNRFTIINKKL